MSSHAPAPGVTRAYRQKNRSITACSECHRRKQKCNRQKPCNYCTDRGVTERCIYKSDYARKATLSPSSGTGLTTPISISTRLDSQEASPEESELERTTQDLSNALGYQSAPTAFNSHSRLFVPEELSKQIPPADVTRTLVDVFFSEANWYFTVLDRHFFDVQHRKWLCNNERPLEADIHFPALLLQVLALACQFLPPHLSTSILTKTKSRNLDVLGETLSDAGKEVSAFLGRHRLSTAAVEADLMRCAWLKNSGKGTEAWYSLIDAVRSAQEQKLEQESAKASDLYGMWEAEHRRRLWACLFTWESHMALQLGRARLINLADCSVQSPMDCDMPEDPSRTLFEVGTAPSHYTSAIVKYRLALLIHELMDRGAFKKERANYADIQDAHANVQAMLEELPPVVQTTNPDRSWDVLQPEIVRHRLQISIITNSFLVSIHRPHIFMRSESLEAAIVAAKIVLLSSQDLFDITEPHQYKLYTNVFYTIDTAMLLSAIVSTLPAVHPQRESSLEVIRQAIRRLSILKTRNPAAIAGEKALIRFMAHLGVNDAVDVATEGQHSAFSLRSPLSTDPMQQLETLMSQPDTSSFPSSAEKQTPPTDALSVDSGIFMEVINDSSYTFNWLESTILST